ncbi:MAG: four helix bundle protein, partial [Paramuribaculum sp.]|nr:four helix bundle protein [Paramuribaculum sp.]
MKGDFSKLTVWQRSIELAELIYRFIPMLPQEEKFALGNQMRRAVVSIPSNIAEGYGRRTETEFIHFLHIARGSNHELLSHMILCKLLFKLPDESMDEIFNNINQISKMLN